MIGQTQTATASSADGYYYPNHYIDGVVTSHQEQSGTLTDNSAVANQYTKVTATGINPSATSSQVADIVVGDN
jgi:hypothetical protein